MLLKQISWLYCEKWTLMCVCLYVHAKREREIVNSSSRDQHRDKYVNVESSLSACFTHKQEVSWTRTHIHAKSVKQLANIFNAAFVMVIMSC